MMGASGPTRSEALTPATEPREGRTGAPEAAWRPGTPRKESIMAKKVVTAVIKLQCPAGKATPAPPVGPALGPHGVSAPQFCQQFNDRTKGMEAGLVIPAVITVYADKTFTFILKTPPASVLIKRAAGIEKGSGVPHKQKVGRLASDKLEAIAKQKM